MFLCITHSPRQLDFSRSSSHFLERRYGKSGRLNNLPEFNSLNKQDLPEWKNNLTIWKFNHLSFAKPELLNFSKKDYTVNHAIFDGDNLTICGSTFLEICSKNFRTQFQLSSNWFAGGHTVYMDINNDLVVACSGSDSLLIFDVREKKLKKILRMPEKNYGFNYDIKPEDDIREHYINNDRQLCHINCAFPTVNGYLVTAFIQGAVGLFDFEGNYNELVSGFRGCHGARTRPGLEGFYFSDTCKGTLIEIDQKSNIKRTFSVDSKWLHDCQWISGDIYLFSLSDKNMIQLWDIEINKKLWEIKMDSYGKTTLLLSCI